MPSDDSFRELTDEQWVWLFINEAIDREESFESMCDDCKHEVTSSKRCSRCGKVIRNKDNGDVFINPNFDADRYEKLSKYDDSVDTELQAQIKGDDCIVEQADRDRCNC